MRGTLCVVIDGACSPAASAAPFTGSNHAPPTTHPYSMPAGQQETVNSGAEGARTPDLLGAIQALSQLSYSPVGTRNLDAAPLIDNPCNLTASRQPPRCVVSGAWLPQWLE